MARLHNFSETRCNNSSSRFVTVVEFVGRLRHVTLPWSYITSVVCYVLSRNAKQKIAFVVPYLYNLGFWHLFLLSNDTICHACLKYNTLSAYMFGSIKLIARKKPRLWLITKLVVHNRLSCVYRFGLMLSAWYNWLVILTFFKQHFLNIGLIYGFVYVYS